VALEDVHRIAGQAGRPRSGGALNRGLLVGVVLVGARARDVLVVVHFEVVSVLLADPVVDSDVLKVVNLLVL
jgi:hypothetical protein